MFTVNGERVCGVCGKVFQIHTWNQKYCSEECSHYAEREHNIMRKRLNRERNNAAQRAKTKAKREAKDKPKPAESLSDVAQKARGLGLTYGQYMVWREQHDR